LRHSDGERLREVRPTVVDASAAFMRAANGLSTLIDLTDAQTTLLVLLNEVEDDTWTEEERAGLEQRLEEVSAALLTKAEHYAGLIRKLDYLIGNDDAEIKRHKARKERKERAVEWLKARLLDHVRRQPGQRIETASCTIGVAKNPPKAEVLEELLVPARFKEIRTSTHIDLNAIKKAIKAGEDVPGVVLTRSERLSLS
jgi:hypothetical protein